MSDTSGTERESRDEGNGSEGREGAHVQSREARGLREGVGGGFGAGERKEGWEGLG